MPIKNFKPNTPGTRGMSTLVNEEITASTPEKSLLVKKSKTGGRNNQKVAVVATNEINVLDLVATDYLLIDESSVNKIEEVLK